MAETANNEGTDQEQEVEETNAPEQENETKEKSWDGDFDADRAKKTIETLRKENKELNALKRKLTEHEKAKLTDQQRVEQERDEARQERDSSASELARLRAAVKYGIEEDDLDLLGSGTPDEIDARAKRLSERLAGVVGKRPASTKPRENLRGGADPTVEAEETDLDKIGAAMFRR